MKSSKGKNYQAQPLSGFRNVNRVTGEMPRLESVDVVLSKLCTAADGIGSSSLCEKETKLSLPRHAYTLIWWWLEDQSGRYRESSCESCELQR